MSDPALHLEVSAPVDTAIQIGRLVVYLDEAARPTPAWLPARDPEFSGREEELARLWDLLSQPDRPPGAVLSGPPGAGKTALAVEWAHQVRDRFPDGQLVADLGGPRGDELLTASLLGRFLRAMGVGRRLLPHALADRVALFRARLADRRVLILLDDVSREAIVRDLLPTSAESFAIVTSRHRLGGLVVDGMRPVPVGPATHAGPPMRVETPPEGPEGSGSPLMEAREWAELLQSATAAARTGDRSRLWTLACAAAAGDPEELALILDVALAEAVHAGDLRVRGDAHARSDERERALSRYREALAVYTELDNMRGQARAWWCIGESGGEPLEAYGQAVTLYTRCGDAGRAAWARCRLGQAFLEVGDHRRAAFELTTALTAFDDLADDRGRAHALCALGDLAHAFGEPAAARQCWLLSRQALGQPDRGLDERLVERLSRLTGTGDRRPTTR